MSQLSNVRETITRHTTVHEQIARMCSGFRRDSHPMALMCALVGALAAFYHDVLDVENPQHRALAATRLLSKMPTIAAMSYKYTIEQPAAYPRNDLSMPEISCRCCLLSRPKSTSSIRLSSRR